MRVSCPTKILDEKFSLRDTIRLLKDAGFDCFDLSMYSSSEEIKQLLSAEDYVQQAQQLRRFAEELGITCNQTHTPFPTSLGDGKDEDRFETQLRALEISAIMGASIAVVHPIQHLNYADHQRELFPMNVAFYKRLIPYAEKFGIKIATENMWQTNNGSQVPSDSVCSRSWEFCELIDTVDSPWLVGCLDIGHVSLLGADIAKFIQDMGPDRLQALHIHDTDFVHDSHTLPFTLSIDYESVARALGKIGYRGDFTFEANPFFRRFPAQLCLPAAKLMCETGRYLANIIENQ